jgi:hypothetical protein
MRPARFSRTGAGSGGLPEHDPVDKLIARYEHSRDGDNFGWLELEVRTADFRGRAGTWVQWQDLDEFADTLSLYPIRAEAPLRGEWGRDPHISGEGNLAVAIEPANRRGGLDVKIALASYHPEVRDRIRTGFRTGYAELQDFARSLKLMVRKETDEAVLSAC